MRLLLDSHVLLWLITDSLPPEAAQQLADERNELLISAVSIWELEVKRVKGTLAAPDDMLARAEDSGFASLTSRRTTHSTLPVCHAITAIRSTGCSSRRLRARRPHSSPTTRD